MTERSDWRCSTYVLVAVAVILFAGFDERDFHKMRPRTPMSKLTSDMVERAVQKYWSKFCSKSIAEVSDFYSSTAVVFGPAAERAKSGSVATMRRAREYMHPEATVTVRLGRIEVQPLSDTVAIASYPYAYVARNVAKDFRGTLDQQVDHARATQVFELRDGALKIVHEHISAVMNFHVDSR